MQLDSEKRQRIVAIERKKLLAVSTRKLGSAWLPTGSNSRRVPRGDGRFFKATPQFSGKYKVL
jgi:hypothetical protein